ncbi:MAG TPA: glycosyltransferase family A protein [Candidatus Saccharimonadaceae bacterium]|jgi:glycosyltransferase involved in cell wall biosynthesis|nr:glycosyltransferase family A protein [Candidatus Saccharimonadaceae bacterium]
MPALSVLLPVRDAGPYLAASLASLWRQSFRDFEVVAVDDGSRDGSGERLERAALGEPRLRVLHQDARGLPAALNAALATARGPLIARHDADDLSHARRFARQHAWLGAHPGDAVVGCRLRVFPAAATGAGMQRWAAWHNALLTHDEMAREALIDSPLAHGTALVRRRALEDVGGWNERGWPEDLDLWLRLLERGARFAKLPQTLYGWRQHAASATRRDPRYRPEAFLALKRDALERGLLRGARHVCVVGVGRSLARWRDALGAARPATALEAARPTPAALAAATAPAVLVFGVAAARARWRAALMQRSWVEMRDFVFVA